MKKVYLMLSQADSLIQKLIKLYTGARYNHVSICLNDNLDVFYSFGRRNLYIPLIGGFVEERINKGLYSYFKNTECLIYSFDVEDKQLLLLEGLLNCYICNRGRYKYNLAGFLGNIIGIPLESRYRHTCSEFIALLLQQSGIHRFTRALPLVKPGDFNRMNGLVKIYEGRMSNINTEQILKGVNQT